MRFLFLIVSLCCLGTVMAQQEKKIINNDAYDSWKTLSNETWTPSGKFVSYQIKPGKGDGYLYFLSTENEFKDSILKGTKAKLHYEDLFATFIIKPGYDTIRNLKLAKTKRDKFPKDSLGIIWFEKDSILKIPNVKSYQLAHEGNWLAYLSTEDLRAECPKYKFWQIFKKRRGCDRVETTGHTLTLLNPVSGKTETIHQVTDYQFNKSGKYLTYTTSEKGETDTLSAWIYDFDQQKHIQLLNQQLSIKSARFDDQKAQLVFLTSSDTNENKTYSLAYWSPGKPHADIVVDTLTKGLKEGWSVSEFGAPYFSYDGEAIYFGTNKKVEQEPEDTLLKSEKANVDIWSWTDKRLQPQQLSNLKYDEKEQFLTAFYPGNQSLVHLENNSFERVRINRKSKSEYALISNNEKQKRSYSWEFPWVSNYGIINLKTGEKEMVISDQGYTPSLSPSGEFLVWYNGNDSTWLGMATGTKEKINLTGQISNHKFYSDNNGSPYNPYPLGVIGWVKQDNQEKVIISSEFDLWLVDPVNITPPECLSKEKGLTHQVYYDLYNFEHDSAYIDLENTALIGIEKETKSEFITTLTKIDSKQYLKGGHSFYYIEKAKKSDKLMFRKMNLSNYPELYVTDPDFTKVQQLSYTNPQQKDYNWATVDLVHWKTYKGLEMEGLLYKPENFDSTKSYPMIVYFYEKYDDRIHSHYIPKPTASIVYPTEYASNGYIVFIPNILYTPGHPAQSAYDCIVSGTDYLTNKYNWIDTNKLGLQGQSWGGYQTAQLITMTNKYACGMAGAPVSNMFSAYGGIRWNSGLSRMFQYERTQSRIGCTIWDCPELYIENSPIFGLPKVNTPLLIMHNDADGSVPWYQGIEMFVGLRRLDKPVWMLNYTGDDHNLRQKANKEDLSIRMRQFFDYYLKDEPIPVWMKEGVPAIDKGDPANLELNITE